MALTAPDITADVVRARLHGEKADIGGAAFRFMLVACLTIVLGALVALITSVSGEGIGVFSTRGVADFIQRPYSIVPERAGVYQAIVGTVTCAVIVALLAFPLGLASAIYLEEYAGDNVFTRMIDIVIRNLAGVPAVVYGLLGYALFVTPLDLPFFTLRLNAVTGGSSVLSAGLTLSILVLPIVVITSAEAIRAVPSNLREGGFGVGATRWEVTRTLVLPSALPGVLTGTILGLARALGEAAPLILVGAQTSGFSGGDPGDLTGRFNALPNLIAEWSSLPRGNWTGNTQAAIIVILVLVLGINAVGIILRNRFDKQK